MVLSLVLLLTGCPVVDKICGASGKDPEKFFSEASLEARALVDQAFRDLPDKVTYDVHVHVLGDNEKENGCFINPRGKSFWHIFQYLRFEAYLSAGQVKDKKMIDAQYITHLVKLARNSKYAIRLHLLAFDKYYDRDGKVNLEKTEFYIPNEYVFKLSRAYSDIFIPVISVHPYRKDAVAELEKWAKKGARLVKWIPNVQGINPADENIVPFYQAMRKFNMVLLTHSGEEYALDSHDEDHFGNPLLLRLPLDLGVRVIIAHCASAGENEDLDNTQNGKIHNFDLFMRLMDEKKYEELLFADISGVTQFNRMDKALATMLARNDLHSRLVNGSDYPLPAINILIHTGKLVKKGFITKEEQEALNEIYDYNPLLFDFVLKRLVRLPGTKQQFSASVFRNNPAEIN